MQPRTYSLSIIDFIALHNIISGGGVNRLNPFAAHALAGGRKLTATSGSSGCGLILEITGTETLEDI
jgi:hypothetical protein